MEISKQAVWYAWQQCVETRMRQEMIQGRLKRAHHAKVHNIASRLAKVEAELAKRSERFCELVKPVVRQALKAHNHTAPAPEYFVAAYDVGLDRFRLVVEITKLIFGGSRLPVPNDYFDDTRPTSHLRQSIRQELARLLPEDLVERGLRVTVAPHLEGADKAVAHARSLHL